jgi:hypothetical protein
MNEKSIIKSCVAATRDIDALTNAAYKFLLTWCDDFIAHYWIGGVKHCYSGYEKDFTETLLFDDWILHHNRCEYDDDFEEFEQAKRIYIAIVEGIKTTKELFDEDE